MLTNRQAQSGVMQQTSHALPLQPVRPCRARLNLARLHAGKTLSSSGRDVAAELPLSTRSIDVEVVPEEPGLLRKLSDAMPARNKLVLACASAFCLSNMDKVNFTVAIIPMAQELGWSPTVSGLVQSCFFWGFFFTQVPGGYLSSNLGGHKTLPPSVALWSVVTALLPFAATTSMPALCATRALIGVGEAVAPSSIIDMLARTIPKEQRAGAVASAFSGLHAGSILGLLMSPAIINTFGWRGMFGFYGSLGIVWFIAFKALLADAARQEPELLKLLETPRQPAANAAGGTTAQGQIPYRAMLRCRSVQALMFTHLSHNWFQYTMLSWLPTYFTDTLSVDLMHAAQTALLPPLAGFVASSVVGRGADALLARGAPLASVRKLAQCIAFLAPATLLGVVCTNEAVVNDASLSVGLITAALGISSFSLAGLYCTHQDMSPKYASAMLGLTNTAASIPGIVGVALVGFLLDSTGGSWEMALFGPSACILTLGTVVYVTQCRNDPIDFDSPEHDHSPFLWEARLAPVRQAFERISSWFAARKQQQQQ